MSSSGKRITATAIQDGLIIDADVNAAAAIARSKLALTGTLVNADVASGAAIAYSKLSLNNAIQTSDLVANVVTQVGIATGSTASPTTTSTTQADIPEMSVTLTTTGGFLLAWHWNSIYLGAADHHVWTSLALDGSGTNGEQMATASANARRIPFTLVYLFTGVSAGSHTVKARWNVTSGATATAEATSRGLIVLEVKR